MAVYVDESGADRQSAAVDDFRIWYIIQETNVLDCLALDQNIGLSGRAAGAVNQVAVFQQYHQLSSPEIRLFIGVAGSDRIPYSCPGAIRGLLQILPQLNLNLSGPSICQLN